MLMHVPDLLDVSLERLKDAARRPEQRWLVPLGCAPAAVSPPPFCTTTAATAVVDIWTWFQPYITPCSADSLILHPTLGLHC